MFYILGHKNPDTDSIASTIAYADFLKQQGKKVRPIALGKSNKETDFVLKKFQFDFPEIKTTLPPQSKIILLDHNEESQSIDNRSELDLIEIIDHHKVKLETEKPISICIKPLGSSCSIVAEKFWQEDLKITPALAGILIAGIISDTLYFRSPTTTEKDKEIVKRLNQVAKIQDLEKFSLEMFKAKSDLGDISVSELIKLDYKEFDFNGHKIAIGVMETTNKDFALKQKEAIENELKKVKDRDRLEGVFFSVIDILEEESWTLTSGEKEKELFQKIFSAEEKNGILFKDKLVSRKKQMVPIWEEYFKRTE